MKMEEDNKWRAEEDARTLMEYQKILKDKGRMAKAKTILEEKQDELKSALENYKKK